MNKHVSKAPYLPTRYFVQARFLKIQYARQSFNVYPNMIDAIEDRHPRYLPENTPNPTMKDDPAFTTAIHRCDSIETAR